MRTVWKYEIPLSGAPVKIEMPASATLLPVADCPGHGHAVAIWAVVDPDVVRVHRYFCVTGTGGGIADGERYVATAIWRQVTDLGNVMSPLVWHVFEVTS